MKYRGAPSIMRSSRIGSIAAALILSCVSAPSLAQFSISEFNPWSSYTISAGPRMIADFDGNGRSDIRHVAKNTDHVHVWLSQGSAKFDVKEFSPWSGYPTSGVILIGDFDGNKRSDVFHAVDGADYAYIWTSVPRSFEVKAFRPWTGYDMSTGTMLIGDFDGDGKSDVFHAIPGSHSVKIWNSNGGGTFDVQSFSPRPGYVTDTGW
jgi:hypothetical protein